MLTLGVDEASRRARQRARSPTCGHRLVALSVHGRRRAISLALNHKTPAAHACIASTQFPTSTLRSEGGGRSVQARVFVARPSAGRCCGGVRLSVPSLLALNPSSNVGRLASFGLSGGGGVHPVCWPPSQNTRGLPERGQGHRRLGLRVPLVRLQAVVARRPYRLCPVRRVWGLGVCGRAVDKRFVAL